MNYEALSKSLMELDAPDVDSAAIALAETLSQRVDAAVLAGDDVTLGNLAPKYLAALQALGMTPAARALPRAATGSQSVPGGALAALRAKHTPTADSDNA